MGGRGFEPRLDQPQGLDTSEEKVLPLLLYLQMVRPSRGWGDYVEMMVPSPISEPSETLRTLPRDEPWMSRKEGMKEGMTEGRERIRERRMDGWMDGWRKQRMNE